ncbi:hypothetical protein ACVXHB_05910 [Escherichia coli]
MTLLQAWPSPTLAALKSHFRSVKHNPVLVRQLPVKNLTLVDGSTCPVVSVYDLVLANYGLDRGLEDENSAKDYAEIKPYTQPGVSKLPACRASRSKPSLVNLPILPINAWALDDYPRCWR